MPSTRPRPQARERGSHARTTQRSCKDGGHRRDRDVGQQPRLPPPGPTLGTAGSRAGPAPRTGSAPRAAAPAAESTIDQLKELGELKSQGILTEEEFAAQKAKLLGG